MGIAHTTHKFNGYYYLLRKVGAQWKGRVAKERESKKKEEERRTSSFDGLIG